MQLIFFQRFREKTKGSNLISFRRIFTMTGQKDHRRLTSCVPQCFCRLKSVHSRHFYIQKNAGVRKRLFFYRLLKLLSVRKRPHLQIQAAVIRLQLFSHDFQKNRLIITDPDSHHYPPLTFFTILA